MLSGSFESKEALFEIKLASGWKQCNKAKERKLGQQAALKYVWFNLFYHPTYVCNANATVLLNFFLWQG